VETQELIRKIMEKEKPDFVAITGDTVSGEFMPKNLS
jgi:predicted MPP superfamily phosphohydrolase